MTLKGPLSLQTILAQLKATVTAFETAIGAPPVDPPAPPPTLPVPPPPTDLVVTNRTVSLKPAMPAPWPVGTILPDATFGCRVARITDGTTLPGNVNSSHQSPSASHQLAWNTTSTRFYTMGVWKCVPWTFNATTMQATRIAWPGSGTARINDGGLVINSVALEPQFSWVDANALFINIQNTADDWPVLAKYDLSSHVVTTLLNLGTIPHVTIPQHTYCGAVYSCETAPERIVTFFGGASQDAHFLAAVFQVGTPTICTVIDTLNSLIYLNGATAVATSLPLGFLLHHAQMDRTGRYITLEPTQAGINAGKAPKYIVDLTTNSIVPLAPYPMAHTVMGWGDFINGDFPGATPYDNAQWSYRTLVDIAHPRNLIKNPQTLGETYLDGHTSWNNALASSLQPVLTELYRAYDGPNDVTPKNTAPWRAWDDEIISIQTDGVGTTTEVRRYCHHHSIVRDDVDTAGAQPFQYQPRPNIAPSGRHAFFTSNGDRTLGTDANPSGNATSRTDVFMVELAR